MPQHRQHLDLVFTRGRALRKGPRRSDDLSARLCVGSHLGSSWEDSFQEAPSRSARSGESIPCSAARKSRIIWRSRYSDRYTSARGRLVQGRPLLSRQEQGELYTLVSRARLATRLARVVSHQHRCPPPAHPLTGTRRPFPSAVLGRRGAQHAVLVVGLDLLLVDAGRQGHGLVTLPPLPFAIAPSLASVSAFAVARRTSRLSCTCTSKSPGSNPWVSARTTPAFSSS